LASDVGPRLWSLAFLLFAGVARGQPQRADRALAGYSRHVRLEAEEVGRIAGLARTRPTVLAIWSFCMGRRSLSETHADVQRFTGLAKTLAERVRIAFPPVRTAGRGKIPPAASTSPGAVAPPLADFDARALWSALDVKRSGLGISWPAVAAEIWAQSALLNDRRNDHPISPSTISGMAKRGTVSCQHALFMLSWLANSPEDFLQEPAPLAKNKPLPPAGKDRRLRWDLHLLYGELNALRREQGLTWAQLATQLGCTPSQLTGLPNVKFAIGIDLTMRIVQWMHRPAADFVYAAEW
jgi:hypothetical protein